MSTYKWQFASRFRRNASGWKSDMPIERIKEALLEIAAAVNKEPVLAADGAVLFLKKLAPAIEQVDSSSGGIGSAANRAIETLVPIIAKAEVSRAVREKWLERLWEAIKEDAMPYLTLFCSRNTVWKITFPLFGACATADGYPVVGAPNGMRAGQLS